MLNIPLRYQKKSGITDSGEISKLSEHLIDVGLLLSFFATSLPLLDKGQGD
jgi:hypothetical protein